MMPRTGAFSDLAALIRTFTLLVAVAEIFELPEEDF